MAGSCSTSYQLTPTDPFSPCGFLATLPQVQHGVVVTKVQDLALGLAELHPTGLSP